jgi:hypothetical protein
MTEEASSSGSATEQDLPDSGFSFGTSRVAPTGIRPQNDFLGSHGAPWPVSGRELVRKNAVANFVKELRVPARSGPLIAEGLPLSGTDLLKRLKQRILGPDILCVAQRLSTHASPPWECDM